MAKLLAMVVLGGLALLVLGLTVGVFLGLGRLLASVAALDLFQATVVTLGSALFLVSVFVGALGIHELQKLRGQLPVLPPIPPEPPAPDSPPRRSVQLRRRGAAPSPSPAARLCPCGSGKPFSSCCGN